MTEVVRAEFSAPWGRAVRWNTTAAVVLLLVLGLFAGPRQLPGWTVLTVVLPLAVLLAPLAFMVRGYRLTDRFLVVQRPGWSTSLPLAGLIEVRGEPDGLRYAVRLFGNNGLYAITGWYWNRRLGRFRAYATDGERVVLLRYADGKRIVVTPGDVQHFIVRTRTLAGRVAATRDPGEQDRMA